MRVSIVEELKFSNGTFIFKSDGTQIDPRSPEGQVIEAILKRQAQDRIDNKAQREKFIQTTEPRSKEKQDALRKKIGKD